MAQRARTEEDHDAAVLAGRVIPLPDNPWLLTEAEEMESTMSLLADLVMWTTTVIGVVSWTWALIVIYRSL